MRIVGWTKKLMTAWKIGRCRLRKAAATRAMSVRNGIDRKEMDSTAAKWGVL